MRLDKWLWAARFFKTRTLAVEGIDGGRVSVNGERSKPAKEAALLYQETEESRARRTVLAAEMKSLPQPRFKGRPTKKTRRDYERWLQQSDDE